MIMMKKRNLALLAALALTFTACNNANNNETEVNTESEWVSLFDGNTTNGWHSYLRDTVASGWSAVDGELRFNPNVPDESRGDIVTDGEYENFELELEWKISPGGNSGIFIGVHEDEKYSRTYSTGIEMQVLDNIDGKDNQVETHLAGTLYDMMGNSEVSKPKPVGEWNQVRIIKNNNRITFWLNDVQTADVEIGSEAWTELLNNSKFKDWEGFAKYSKGRIGLQDHGDVVAYRNIRIKELK